MTPLNITQLNSVIDTLDIYTFCDGDFRFFTAHYGSHRNDARVVFRVRLDSTPEKRVVEKKITDYDRVLPSDVFEIREWLKGHSGYTVLFQIDGDAICK